MYYCENCGADPEEYNNGICSVCGAIIEDEQLSGCCGAPFYEDTDICTSCKDHG